MATEIGYGGTTAWLQVLACHLVCFVTWGLITSYGIFQSHYEETMTRTPSEISWIGTMQIFMLLLVGTISGRASDAGLAHEAVLLGSVLVVLGLFMTSLSTQYYQLFLSQGICIGLGMGTLYMPALSVASSYFKEKKSFAVALTSSGAGSGGLVYPAMVQQLLPRVGFGWTLRSMAFVTLALAIAINLLLRVRVPPRRSGSLIDWRAFTEIPYVFFGIGFFLIYWAVYFAFYYIDTYGHKYAGFTSLDSINILLISNGLGIPGRILPGYIAAHWCGPLNTAIPTATLVAVILYCWIALGSSSSGLYVYAAVYGLVASAIQALFAVSLAALTDDLSRLGTRMGMIFSFVAFASLTGSPVAGALINADGGRYVGAQIWAATSMACGAVALLVARIARTGLILNTKI
ncbi:MFS general substrate transporter [Viridothelium virens]|uniref:MFS general substrate transporter n=1 Tax=Viridothelium virens TaxID=1048519 RepID=A0A6A6H2G9_VIRVR|nr:MFS general substrate transporter [Viridothelium virens]